MDEKVICQFAETCNSPDCFHKTPHSFEFLCHSNWCERRKCDVACSPVPWTKERPSEKEEPLMVKIDIVGGCSNITQCPANVLVEINSWPEEYGGMK